MKLNTKDIDRPFWILFLTLVIVAFIALLSAGGSLVFKFHSLAPLAKQFLLLIVGVGIAYGVQYVPSWLVRLFGYPILAVSWICLFLIIIPGSPFAEGAHGAERWFKLSESISFQPSELAKLGLTIVVADLLSHIHSKQDATKFFFWTLGLTIVTCFPILINNLSTAVLICLIVLMLWILARIPAKYILSSITVALIAAAIGYTVVEFGYVRKEKEIKMELFKRATTWVSRIDTFIEEFGQEPSEERDLDKNHYQRTMAKVAIAHGGVKPWGVLPGNSKERAYVPLPYMDYIFAIIVEETGILGAIGLIFVYLAILFRACLACSRYADPSAILVVMGLALMLTWQAFISMAVSVGLGPVTGQPLPLISKGGTSVLVTCAYFGIMMGVAREQILLGKRERQMTEESFNNTPDISLDIQDTTQE